MIKLVINNYNINCCAMSFMRKWHKCYAEFVKLQIL